MKVKEWEKVGESPDAWDRGFRGGGIQSSHT